MKMSNMMNGVVVEGDNENGSNGSNSTILKKGPWTASEDAILIDYIKKHGEGNWNAVMRNTCLQRCGKSCRLRWSNHLRPNLKKGAFSFEEEALIIQLHSRLGNKWARISTHLPGRTDNEIKNYWNTRIKRRLRHGLSIYPTNFPINQPPPLPPQPMAPPPQPPTYSFSYLQTPQTTNANNHLPMFDPISFPSSSIFSLQHVPFMFSQLIKTPNSNLAQPNAGSSQLGSIQSSLQGFGFNPGLYQIQGSNLGSNLDLTGRLNFELPSNQKVMKNEYEMVDDHEVKINAGNMIGSNSGYLSDLLQESQVKAKGGKLKEENEFGLLWDISSSYNASPDDYAGAKKEDEESETPQLMNLMDDNDMSKIIKLAQAPTWSDDGGGKESSSVGQSSVISTDDNKNGLDQTPKFQTLGASSSTDYDDDGFWNPSFHAWGN